VTTSSTGALPPAGTVTFSEAGVTSPAGAAWPFSSTRSALSARVTGASLVLVQVTVLRTSDPVLGQGRYADTAAVATTGVAVALARSSRPAPTSKTPRDTSCALLTRADFSAGPVQSGCC
jgi:hypothetical protein